MAHAVQEWIARVCQVDVFVARQLPAGTRWFEGLAAAVHRSTFAILCITRESLHAPWIHFEAGAAFKDLRESRVIPYLLDVAQTRLQQPLAAFQAIAADREGTRRMLGEIGLEVDQAVFDREWPALERSLQRLRLQAARRRYGPVAGLATLLLAAGFWGGHLMSHSVFPSFQPALAHLNTANAGPLRVVRWGCARNPHTCPRGYTHTFEAALSGGYATLWLDKILTSADLQARDILISVVFGQGARELEVGISDESGNRSFFDCRSDDQAAVFVVPLRQVDLSAARCRTSTAAIRHFSIGYAAKQGDHGFELLDLRVVAADVPAGPRSCQLRPCAN